MNKAMVFDKFRKFETEFAGRPLVVETGKMTQLANGACKRSLSCKIRRHRCTRGLYSIRKAKRGR